MDEPLSTIYGTVGDTRPKETDTPAANIPLCGSVRSPLDDIRPRLRRHHAQLGAIWRTTDAEVGHAHPVANAPRVAHAHPANANAPRVGHESAVVAEPVRRVGVGHEEHRRVHRHGIHALLL